MTVVGRMKFVFKYDPRVETIAVNGLINTMIQRNERNLN